MEKRKVRLNISGVDLTITTENTQEETLQAAAAIEQSINSMMTYNNRVSTTVACILTALRFYDDLQAGKLDNEHLRSQLSVYLEDSEKTQKELLNLQKENDNLKEELRLIRLKLNPQKETPEELAKKAQSFVKAKPSGRYIKKTLDDMIPEQQNFITFFEKQKTD